MGTLELGPYQGWGGGVWVAVKKGNLFSGSCGALDLENILRGLGSRLKWGFIAKTCPYNKQRFF